MSFALLLEDGSGLLLEDGSGLLLEGQDEPEDLPADLGIAVVAKFLASPALVEGFSGGIYRDKAEGDPDGPQAVIRILSSRPAHGVAGDWLDVRFRFTVFAADSNLAGELRGLIEDEYTGASLVHARGYTTAWFVANQSEDENPRPGDRDLTFKAIVDFMFNEFREGA